MGIIKQTVTIFGGYFFPITPKLLCTNFLVESV